MDAEQLASLMRAVTDDLNCGITPVITMCMYERRHNPLVQAEGCAALEGIMLRSTDITASAKDPWWVDVIHPVLEAMKSFPEKKALQTNACDMLWKLCLQDGNFHSLILAKGGLALILEAMKNHITCGRLQYASCGALRRLLTCASQKDGAAQTPRPSADTGLNGAVALVLQVLDTRFLKFPLNFRCRLWRVTRTTPL